MAYSIVRLWNWIDQTSFAGLARFIELPWSRDTSAIQSDGLHFNIHCFASGDPMIGPLARLLLLMAVLSLANVSSAQVWREWENRCDGPASGADGANLVTVDRDGNVYVTGQSAGTFDDYLTIKYDAAGHELWQARYNGPGDGYDRATSVVVDEAGNVYVTGRSRGVYGNYDDYVTIKYDASGESLWVARYNGPLSADDQAFDMAVDDAGYVYVTGWSLGGGPPASWDYATVKYDPDGRQVWSARYNGPANDSDTAWDLALDHAGNVLVTGASTGVNTAYDYATVKYGPSGNQLWVARYNGNGNSGDYIQDVVVDGDGNVYVTGSSWGWPTCEDYVTIKYDSAGNPVWFDRYDGPSGDGDDWARAIALDPFGNAYVTGHSRSLVGPAHDYGTVKYDADGTRLWVARYNGPVGGDEKAWSLAVDLDGSVYVTGQSPGIGSLLDYATVKYDGSGNEVWAARYDGTANGDDKASSVVVDGQGRVYVTGSSVGAGTGADYLTVKYTQDDPASVAVLPWPSENAVAVSANPFSGTTGFSFSLPSAQRIKVSIHDTSGKSVRGLADGPVSSGLQTFRWDGRDDRAVPVASGVYFCRIEVAMGVMTRRLVKVQ